ncbi:MAG: S9 family peptidase [Rhodanobacteraceae bacterium]|nr:MAG: S9 family peptidase [Rhodanobacteraceae bacterium]
MKPTRCTAVLLLALASVLPLAAQARQLTAADYARAAKFLGRSTDPLVGHNYDPRVYHEVKRVHWLDATHFWYRDHDATGDHFFTMDAATGAAGPAFDQTKLGAALGKVGGKAIDAQSWPHDFDFHPQPDGKLVVRLGAKQYTCDLSTAGACTARKKTATPVKGTPGFQALSPNGKLLAFIKDNNLWLRDTATGKATPLTTDGSKDDGYGSPDSGPMPLVRWAPDSKRLVAFRQDSRGVENEYTLETRIGHPTLHTQQYALPGDKHVPLALPVIIDVATHTATPLKMAEEQQLGPWMDIQWAPDSKTFALVSTSRDRRHEWFRIANAATGDVRTAFEYTAKDFYQGWYAANGSEFARPDWAYLAKAGQAIWPTEQNNWMNLYLYDLATGKQLHPITTGPGDVIQVLHRDRQTRTLWYIGVGRTAGVNPYYQQLFKVNLDTGNTTLLTPEDANHDITMSKDGKYFVDAYSTPTQPPVTVLRAASDGRVIATVAKTDISPLVADGWVPPVPFTVKARDGKTDLYGLLYKPSNFDPHSHYPVIDFIYPGPQIGSILTFGFRSERGASQALAELGFIVVTVDGMGTPYRSASFQREWYGDMGDDTLPDQIATLKQLAARRPWMDLGRVGIWGHSGGGNATVSAMLHYPDFFKVGWAESGNYDNRDYSYAWGEKWEGLLVKGKDGKTNYDNQASELLAGKLKGHLMLVHGAIDDNVPPANTYLMVNALMNANKDFDLIMVPDEHHHFGTHTPYVTRRMFDYFVTHLAGNTPPHEFAGMPKTLTQ